MGTYVPLDAVDRFGNLARSSKYAPNTALDKWGNMFSSSHWSDQDQVDKWGNLKITSQPQAPGIGYQNQDGQLATHRQTWTSSGQTLPLALPVPNGSFTRLGAIAGAEIIATGSLVTTGALWIDGPTTTINTAVVTQTGGGIVTLVDPQTVGVNGVSNINVQTGATLRLGNDWTKVHGWFFGANGNAQMANVGTVEVRSADYVDNNSTLTQNGGNTTAGSLLRYIGKPGTGTSYNSANSTQSNTGTTELIDNFLLHRRGFIGTGTVKVASGSAIHASPDAAYGFQTFQATQTYEIAGEGFDRAGVAKGAFVVKANAQINGVSMTLTQSARVSAHVTRSDINNGFSLPFVSTAEKILSVGSPAVGAEFGDAALAFVKLNVANPNHLGATKVDFGTLQLNAATSLPNSAYVELTGNGRLDVAVANSIRSLRSTSATTSVALTAALTLSAQEATPVASNFTGAGNVNVNGGPLLLNRAAVSSTGVFVVGTAGKIGTVQTTTALSGALNFGGANATLVVANVGGAASRLTATTVSAASGFRVDVPAGLVAGAYTILTRTAGTPPAPSVGVNDSGLSATFAWVGNDLRMTLA